MDGTRDKPLLMIGHCLALMCQTNELLTLCHREMSFAPLLKFKEIELFLNQSKESIDQPSYLKARSKVTPI